MAAKKLDFVAIPGSPGDAVLPKRDDQPASPVGRGDVPEMEAEQLLGGGAPSEAASAPKKTNKKKTCCGEEDGKQLLGLSTEWAVTAVAFAIMAYVVVEDPADPMVGPLSPAQAFYLLEVAAPLVLVVLGYVLAFSFAGGVPSVKLLAFSALYAGLTVAAHYLGTLVPWLTASSAGATLPFYLVVLVLSSKPGEGAKYDFGAYVSSTFHPFRPHVACLSFVASVLTDDCFFSVAASL